MPDLVDNNDKDKDYFGMNPDEHPPNPEVHSSDHGICLPQSPQPQPFSSEALWVPPGISHVSHLTINSMFLSLFLTSTY